MRVITSFIQLYLILSHASKPLSPMQTIPEAVQRGNVVNNLADEVLRSGRHYWIEVLVFADYTIRERFQTFDRAQLYVKTLLSLANELFHHPTLGTNISLVVRDIIWISKNGSIELLNAPSLIQSVHRFCTWAYLHYYVRYNYDHALFLSRNILEAAGVSPLRQMCNTRLSCTLVEESGFFSAYPIAHEIMHSMGIEHDGESNDCDFSGLSGNIMAPLIMSANHNHHWSHCTRSMLKSVITSPKFDCLSDYPIDQYRFTLERPRFNYWPADEQCRVLTGSTQGVACTKNGKNLCRELFCSRDGTQQRCERILNHGLLDGTACGANKVCHRGRCILLDSNTLLPPERSFQWTPCSKSCGTGTQFKLKEYPLSTNVSTEHHSDQLEYRLCNGSQLTQCPVPIDSRELECFSFNKFKLHGVLHQWLPFVDPHEPCRLKCISRSTGRILDAFRPVRDATLCSYGNLDARCIQSECVYFDCSGKVNGSSQRDRCGVCEGDGSTCLLVKDYIHIKISKDDGYRVVRSIPSGAREVIITLYSAVHTMSLYDEINETNTLQHTDPVPRIFLSAEFTYSFSKLSSQTLTSPGPVIGDSAIRVWQTISDPLHTDVTITVEYLALSATSTTK